jgi:hypothetical protein
MPAWAIDRGTRQQERLGRALERRVILGAFLRGEISVQELERARERGTTGSPALRTSR